MEYKLLETEVHKLQDGSPGNDNKAILEKLLPLEVTDVRYLSQMPDFRILCIRRMKLMWRSPKEGETEYCPWVGNRTMEAAQQHIIAWATSALKAFMLVSACVICSRMGSTPTEPRRWQMGRMATKCWTMPVGKAVDSLGDQYRV